MPEFEQIWEALNGGEIDPDTFIYAELERLYKGKINAEFDRKKWEIVNRLKREADSIIKHIRKGVVKKIKGLPAYSHLKIFYYFDEDWFVLIFVHPTKELVLHYEKLQHQIIYMESDFPYHLYVLIKVKNIIHELHRIYWDELYNEFNII